MSKTNKNSVEKHFKLDRRNFNMIDMTVAYG